MIASRSWRARGLAARLLPFVLLWALAACAAAPTPEPTVAPAPSVAPMSTAVPTGTATATAAASATATATATATRTPIPTWTPLPTATPGGPRVTKLGIHLLIGDHKNRWPIEVWPQHLRYARDLVGEWGYVVVLVRLDDLDVERWQYFLDLCGQLHLTPIIRFATWYDNTNRWWAVPIRDNEGGGYFTVAEQYRDFLDHLRWPTKQRLLIIGNEPNRGDEWENQPNGEAYAHFLGDVSRRLRENDPNVVILNGALDLYAPNTNGRPFDDGYRYVDADTFMAQMLKWDKDIFSKVQIWNSHAYPLGPFNRPPNEQVMQFDYLNGAQSPRQTPWPAGIFNRGVNSYSWELYRIAQAGGPALPVMITETGWRHTETTATSPGDATHATLSATQIADYFELAFIGNRGQFSTPYARTGWTPWEDDPRVKAVIPFALNGKPDEWGHSNWLMLDLEGAIYGTYAPYQRMMQLR